jgi:putative transposase
MGVTAISREYIYRMKYNRKKLSRRSLRLRDYDYSQEGAYFITICTVNRSTILGRIKDGKMNLSPIGDIIRDLWAGIADYQSGLEIDQYVVMPNHIHGIIVITEKTESPCRGLINQTPTKWILMQNPTLTLGKIIRSFKAKASYAIHKRGFIDFSWQRNYYEHIIRNERELNKIQKYIMNNPRKWDLDRENPRSDNFDVDHDIYFKDIIGI